MRAMCGRQRVGMGVLAAVIALAGPAFAQSTGMVKGKVTDGNKAPVDGAKIVIEYTEGVNRKFEVKTNRRGEYIQIGLQPGVYRITASKDGVGTASDERKISIGSTEQVDLTLAAAAAGGSVSKEEEAFRGVFTEGIEASKKGDQDGALAKFREALKLRPDCYACQFNIGGAHLTKKEYDQAETAFKAASALDASSAEPYNALAQLYNTQKKFDQAAAMTAEAIKRGGAAGSAGAGSPETLFNQGVTLWNAGKIGEARTQFEAAAKAKPDYAEAHYWVGMANVNEGKLPEATVAFEQYLKLAPTGQYAETVKKVLGQIKQ